MSIAMLYPILIHPILLPPAPKCMLVHQFFRGQFINHFSNLSTIYLPYLYDIQAPSPLEDLCIILPGKYWFNYPHPQSSVTSTGG